MKRRIPCDRKGFSLVELIIVIAIAVILVGLLLPNLVSYLKKAEEAKQLHAFDSLTKTGEAFVMDMGVDPNVDWDALKGRGQIIINGTTGPNDDLDRVAKKYFEEEYGDKLDSYVGVINLMEDYSIDIQVWLYYENGILKYSYNTKYPGVLIRN